MRKKLKETYLDAEKNLRQLSPKSSENLQVVKSYLNKCMDGIREIHDSGCSGFEVVALRTLVIDKLLCELFDLAGREYCLKYPKVDQKCAVIAIGGYGRGELSPASDIDIMFLYPWKIGPYIETVIERILYILWDTGLDVGYSARNLSESIKASSDLVIKTSLIDSRFICGDRDLYDEYRKVLGEKVLSKKVEAFINAKLLESEERRKKFGDSVYILEPDIKEGDGGLRDLHTALWATRVRFRVKDFKDLHLKGILSDSEYDEIALVNEFMLRVRNDLHFIIGRKSDQMTFELQEKIAENLGYINEGDTLAVEAMMRDFYLMANRIKDLSEIIVDRCLKSDGRRRVGRFITQRELSHGFKIFGGEITVSDKDIFTKNPAAIMRLFEMSQLHGVNIHSYARERLRKNLDKVDDDFINSGDVNRSFMNILKSEWDVTGTLKLMHKLDLLGRFIPEFGQVRCQVQHDIYHIYTVDAHSLFAVEELRKLALGEQKDEYPVRTALMEELERPELLYLAALLHDVGKGKGGKHEELGAEIAGKVAERIGFSSDDVSDIKFLVLNHLRLSHTAQRRDLTEHKLILDFAREMETLERLKMLYLLTYADIRAIGPEVWTEWKSSLFLELYKKTAEVFEKGAFEVEETKEKISHIARDVVQVIGDEFAGDEVAAFVASMPDRYLLSNPPAKIARHFRMCRNYEEPLTLNLKDNARRGSTRVIIMTLDSPGLFYKICGVLAGNGINILGAQIYTRKNGEVFDVFHVKNTINDVPIDDKKWKNVESDLLDVIEKGKKAEAVIKKYGRPSVLGKKYKPEIKPRVIIDNDISDTYTVIEIYAQDRLGLLYIISRTLVKMGLYIDVSKISTMGEQVTDVFYVRDIFGQKIFYDKKLDKIEKALLKAIGE